jgi:ribosome modulation factor
MSKLSAYDLGFLAAVHGKTRMDNPFNVDWSRQQWNRGWVNASAAIRAAAQDEIANQKENQNG